MVLTDGMAGAIGGALLSLSLLVLAIGVWQRRPALAATGGAFVLLATLLWPLRTAAAASPLGGVVLTTLMGGALVLVALLAGWLVHRALRALRAGRVQRAALQQALQQAHDAARDAQTQLQIKQAAAEQADQAQARFFAAASHDLRQPAHALGLYTAALRAGPLAPGQAEIAERMQRSLAALDTLFAALMDVSRMDAGAVTPQWDTVALAPLLQRLADEWAPQAEARGLRLSLHISDSQAISVTDPVLLERVLRNLLANAIKYTEQGGVLLACRLRHPLRGAGSGGGTQASPAPTPAESAHWRIEVWDSGIGIAASDQERVFEEFFQAHAATPGAGVPRGLGLGLAIVQRLSRLLHLRVRLQSRPQAGSVFFVEGLVPAGVAPRAAAAARLGMRRLAGLSVAVLEDDVAVRDAMCRLLRLWDCEVAEGACADDVLAMRSLPADVLIADLRLHDGRRGADEVARLLAAWPGPAPAAQADAHAEIHADVHADADARADIHAAVLPATRPVLWISAETDPAGLRAALPPGATVLTKPVSPARLRSWLEQHQTAEDPWAIGLGDPA